MFLNFFFQHRKSPTDRSHIFTSVALEESLTFFPTLVGVHIRIETNKEKLSIVLHEKIVVASLFVILVVAFMLFFVRLDS